MAVSNGKFKARTPVKIEFLPTSTKRRIVYLHECGIEDDRIAVATALDIETVRNIIDEFNARYADLWGGSPL